MKIKLLITVIMHFNIILFAFCSFANQPEKQLNSLNFCKITKKITNDYEPETFATTNNLLRQTGKEAIYCGEKIIIHGKVLDQNCNPVADAKVYLWQVNCKGKYPYKPLKNSINKDLFSTDQNTTFTGNGTATTNNKGEFVFITAYPLNAHDLAPHINLRVEHRRLGTLQTRIILRDYIANNPFNNPELDELAQMAQKSGSTIYDFSVVMPGEALSTY